MSLNRVTIGLDNDLSPYQWWLLIIHANTNCFSEKIIEPYRFSLTKLQFEKYNMIVCKFVTILSRGRWINSSRPSAAYIYMRQWLGCALVQIMACRHYQNQCWIIISWTLRNKFQWNFNQSFNQIFIQENAFENVFCEMAAILSRGDGLVHVKCISIILRSLVLVAWGRSWVICNLFSHSTSDVNYSFRPANERRRYKVTPSLIGWVQT